jgi:hypothetical protein
MKIHCFYLNDNKSGNSLYAITIDSATADRFRVIRDMNKFSYNVLELPNTDAYNFISNNDMLSLRHKEIVIDNTTITILVTKYEFNVLIGANIQSLDILEKMRVVL